MNETDVTSTYFVLISYSHRELGRLVLNAFSSIHFSSCDVNKSLGEKRRDCVG